ncbi:MAG: DUF1501 domain-containing protein [Pseudomonadota bacterium]
MAYINRRKFITGATAVSALAGTGTLASLTQQRAFAADTSGYKALVCVMLRGGMDHSDTVIPRDAENYDMLRRVRGGIMGNHGNTRARGNLLPLDLARPGRFGGREFGLPANLGPLQQMFNSGDMAIVGDVGPLIEPLDRQGFNSNSVAKPKRLFSHNDQQSTWEALGVEGVRSGWGGKFADAAARSDPNSTSAFSAIATGSASVFSYGDDVVPFRAPSRNGGLNIEIVDNKNLLGRNERYDAGRAALLDFLRSNEGGGDNLLTRDVKNIQAEGVGVTLQFREAQAQAVSLNSAFPGSRLGGQLRTVAETIAMRDLLNVNRQVFFVETGGFDTHNNQASNLSQLQVDISNSFAAFRDAMVAQGDWNNVTIFTISDFGRTLVENGAGTDHGWGGYMMVAGGQVQGGDIYGTMAAPQPQSSSYTDDRGRLIPTTSVEQYAATLGRWFGLDEGELSAALPNLANFDGRNVGFMGGSGA